MLHLCRTIKSTLSRFFAIAAIVALGSGFFAGLMMTGPDMRAAADAYFDESNVWDIRLISTLGFSSREINHVNATEGVEATAASHTVDVVADLEDKQIAARISSFDVVPADEPAGSEGKNTRDREDAANQDANGYIAGDSAVLGSAAAHGAHDTVYLNRPKLISGRYPKANDECVVAANAPHAPLSEGATITLGYTKAGVDKVFQQKTLHVVGTIASPLYPYTKSFGSTTLGTGAIDQYIYVLNGTFSADFPYNELYVSVAGAKGDVSNSSAYKARVDEVKDRLLAAIDEMSVWRKDAVKAAAQSKLNDKIADYEREHTNAYATLDEQEGKLASAAAQLAHGKAALSRAKQQLVSGTSQLDTQYAEGKAKLTRAEEELSANQATLLATVRARGIHASSLEDANAQVASALASIEAARKNAGSTAAMPSAAGAASSALPQSQRGDAAATKSQPDATDRAQERATQVHPQAQPQAERKSSGEQPQHHTLEQQQQQLQQLQQREQQLKELQGHIQACIAARTRLENERASADEKYAAAQRELSEKKALLAQKQQTLAAKQDEYQAGRATFDEQKAKADDTFRIAKEQLDSAQRAIDANTPCDMYLLDRTQHEGAAIYHADTERMDTLARVFPVMFFLVAALVSLTTMTRMIDDHRVLIGTYKALGYSTFQIARHYLGYAVAASGIGAVCGIAILSQVLPSIVMGAYSVIYDIPPLPYMLPMHADIALLAGSLGIGITLAATWCAIATTLREQPAPLMLPRAPMAGKRILLERAGFIWHHLSFSWKITLRNLFLYKRRFYMTAIGIAGCTALLLVGFALHDSIWDIIGRQFTSIVHYNLTVGCTDDADELDVQRVISQLKNTNKVSALERVTRKNMSVASSGASAHSSSTSTSTKTTNVQLVVPQDAQNFAQVHTLQNRITQEPIHFDDNSVVISEKLALLYNLSCGDSITLYDHDLVGNITGEGMTFAITGICENYISNTVFVGRNAYTEASGTEPSFAMLYVAFDTQSSVADELTSAEKEEQDALVHTLHQMPEVSLVSFSNETIAVYKNTIGVVNMVVVVLIVAAVLLAFIVLYNLTNINIEERIREIASLKVLGFLPREVNSYIFRDILILAGIGDCIGLIAGTFLARFVVETAEVEYVMFGRVIHPESYVYACVLTFVFTLLIVAMMCPKLKHINMVESLKSVD